MISREPTIERLATAQQLLLTPFGLRSLAPGHPDYQAQYFGDLRARDLAYHQGTVWPWLIGPFVDAWRLTYPERTEEIRPTLRSILWSVGFVINVAIFFLPLLRRL